MRCADCGGAGAFLPGACPREEGGQAPPQTVQLVPGTSIAVAGKRQWARGRGGRHFAWIYGISR
jgi:hypothetical protein